MKQNKEHDKAYILTNILVIIGIIIIISVIAGIYGYITDWNISVKNALILIGIISTIGSLLFHLRGELMMWVVTLSFTIIIMTIMATIVFGTGYLIGVFNITW